MIVGRAVCKLLDGMTIDVCGNNIVVQNNMGNQDALDKFIAESDKRKAKKYPLVFYVTSRVRQLDEWSFVDTELIIMMNTSEPLLYKERSDKTYAAYIDPIYQKVRTLFESNKQLILEGDREDWLNYVDLPNYGIINGSVGDTKSSKSAVTDYVDARKVKINFKITTPCS